MLLLRLLFPTVRRDSRGGERPIRRRRGQGSETNEERHLGATGVRHAATTATATTTASAATTAAAAAAPAAVTPGQRHPPSPWRRVTFFPTGSHIVPASPHARGAWDSATGGGYFKGAAGPQLRPVSPAAPLQFVIIIKGLTREASLPLLAPGLSLQKYIVEK